MLSIAICEDDVMQQRSLVALLNEIGLNESLDLHTFNSGEELIKSYESGNRYSIILLDMQLNDLNGIQTAKLIKRFDSNCLFIIITSIIEYAIDGYSIGAYDFILKPVDKNKFNSVIYSAVREWQSIMNKVYVIKSRDRLTSIRLSEIRYIESNKN
ncbi:MAG: response regulator transcription factor, partial [Clostridia bacterium]|nr:response regulator transcription factor [Clostridia bacterium]